MPSADGWMHASQNGRFVATFIIYDNDDAYLRNFACTLGSDVPAFRCKEATLNYDSLGVIVDSIREYRAQVGPSKVVLRLANGPVIEGTLDAPLSKSFTVSGRGAWTRD